MIADRLALMAQPALLDDPTQTSLRVRLQRIHDLTLEYVAAPTPAEAERLLRKLTKALYKMRDKLRSAAQNG